MRGKVSLERMLIGVLAILLVLAGGYIGYDQFQKRNLALYQQGVQAGYQNAVVQLFEHASACEQVPVVVKDETINMIAVHCLEGYVSQDLPPGGGGS